jgi:hypothetical protein
MAAVAVPDAAEKVNRVNTGDTESLTLCSPVSPVFKSLTTESESRSPIRQL